MSMNGLEKITDRILAEAQAQAERILADAQAECDKIRKTYAARAEEICQRLSDEAQREGAELVARERASAATERSQAILSVKSRLLDEVFTGAQRSVCELDAEQYTDTLIGLLCAAMTEQTDIEKRNCALYGEAVRDERYEVLFCRRDRERYGQAVVEGARRRLGAKISPEALDRLTLAKEEAAIEGGLVLRCGRIESNCSLELIFADLRRELETEVSRALFEAPSRA